MSKRTPDYDPPPKVPPWGWKSPESTGKLKEGHIRVLEHMLNHKLGRWAQGVQSDFIKSEIGALNVAIAELRELLEERKSV